MLVFSKHGIIIFCIFPDGRIQGEGVCYLSFPTHFEDSKITKNLFCQSSSMSKNRPKFFELYGTWISERKKQKKMNILHFPLIFTPS